MPTTKVTVSFSELDNFRQCPLKWQLSYAERWTKGVQPGGALAKGTLWHQVLETHYKTLLSLRDQPDQTARAAAIASETGGSGNRTKMTSDELLAACARTVRPLLADSRSGAYHSETHELISWMYDGHLEMWGADEHWQVVAVEHAPVVPVPRPDGKPSRFRLKLKIDLVVRDLSAGGGGRLWLVDHKSGSKLPTRKELDINDQFAFYTWAMCHIGHEVFGSVHNAARTQRNKGAMALEDRMSRTRLNRTTEELRSVMEDAYLTCQAAYGNRTAKTGGVAGNGLYSSPNDDTCKWRCDFLDAHLLARKGQDLRGTLSDLGFVQDFTRH